MIDKAIVLHIWKDLRHRDVRLVLVALLFFQSIAGTTLALCMMPNQYETTFQGSQLFLNLYTPFWICIWGAGVIGIKTSRGTLPLILARPVRTTTFVVSSWLAIAIFVFATQLLLIATASLQTLVFMPSALNLGALFVAASKALFVSLVGSAALICMSSLVSGIKDVGLYFLLTVGALMLIFTKQIPLKDIHPAQLQHCCEALVNFVATAGAVLMFAASPDVPISETFRGIEAEGVVALIAVAAVILTWLSLAIARMNRMELSYGAD